MTNSSYPSGNNSASAQPELLREKFQAKVVVEIPLLETEALGVEKLRRVGQYLYQAERVAA